MAINTKYTDKAEWQRGYDYGLPGIKEALDNAENKTKQGIYVAGRIFNKKMAEEHVNKNRKSDDFLAGMETAIQTEFQSRWKNAPAEQVTINPVAGMNGLFQVSYPAGSPHPFIKTTPIKKLAKVPFPPTPNTDYAPLDLDPDELEI